MTEPAWQRVVKALRDDILDGVLPPGLQLRQEALAEQYGVSRVPAREALRQLEAEGLVSSEPNKGAFVSTLSIEEIDEMLDIRIALELRALKLALPGITSAVVAKAKRILAAYDRSDDPQEWRDLNLAFHLCLYAPCKRPRMLKMIEDVSLVNYRFLRTWISTTVGSAKPQAQHRLLLEACAAHDDKRALRLLEAHIEHTRDALRRKRDAGSAAANGRNLPSRSPRRVA